MSAPEMTTSGAIIAVCSAGWLVSCAVINVKILPASLCVGDVPIAIWPIMAMFVGGIYVAYKITDVASKFMK